MKFVQISSTFESEQGANSMAIRLVGERLVACAQLESITSIFRWHGKVEQQPEWRLIVKTRADLFERVSAVIIEFHDYDVPQIVASELMFVSASYASWLADQTDCGGS